MNILLNNYLFRVFILLVIYNISYSVPNVGIVKLFYAKNAIISQFDQQDNAIKDTLLASLEPRLIDSVESLYSFDAFNAESILASWQQVNPNIVSILESVPIYSDNESQNINNQFNMSNNNQYLLIGWITELTYNVSINDFLDTGKKSVIYSLDLRAKYKLFDINTQKPIFEFYATGHGGNARIVPVSYVVNTYHNQQAIDNTLSTFVDSVLHGLLLRHDQGYLNNNDN